MRVIMLHRKTAALFLRCFALLFILLLASCSASSAQQEAIATSTPNTYGGDGIQKGPGSAALTATALSTPVPIICHPPSLTTSANIQGWQTYADKQYPFHFLYPIGWKVGGIPAASADGSDTWYQVMVLPPTAITPIVEESAITEPEYIMMVINLTNPTTPFSNQSTWTPDTAPFLLNNRPTKLSYRFSPGCDEFNRATDPVTFGQHAYFFYQESRDQADKATDSQIFLSIIQSFVYTGGQ